MAQEKLRLIVLHTIRHKESAIIVRGYGSLNGKSSYFLRLSQKNKKHTLSLLHPLSVVDITTSSRSFGELKTIKEFHSVYRLSSIRNNIIKGSIAMFISEIVLKSIEEIEQNRELFLFLERTILRLESIEDGVSNYHLHFLVEFTKILGYLPEIPKQTQGMLFDIPSAKYRLERREEDISLFDKEESWLLSTLYHTSPQKLNELVISRQLRYKFIESILRYINYHTGQNIHCQSLSVLKEVFSSQ